MHTKLIYAVKTNLKPEDNVTLVGLKKLIIVGQMTKREASREYHYAVSDS